MRIQPLAFFASHPQRRVTFGQEDNTPLDQVLVEEKLNPLNDPKQCIDTPNLSLKAKVPLFLTTVALGVDGLRSLAGVAYKFKVNIPELNIDWLTVALPNNTLASTAELIVAAGALYLAAGNRIRFDKS